MSDTQKNKTITNEGVATAVENSTFCGKCNKICKGKDEISQYYDESLECDCCHAWLHVKCANVVKGKYEAITKYALNWYCYNCELGAKSLYEICINLRNEQLKLKSEVNELDKRVKKREENEAEHLNRIIECEKSTSALNEKVAQVKANILSDLSTDTSDNNPLVTLKKDIVAEIKTDLGLTNTNKGNNTSAWKSTNNATPSFTDIIREQLKEDKELEAIKDNLIISGIPESDSDIDHVVDLISKELDITPIIESAQRCGKLNPEADNPRLLKIRITNSETRRKILLKAKNLRNSTDAHTKEKVYIRPDETRKQQLASKNLRDDLRARKLANPDKTYRIIKGEIKEVTPQ